jgi:subtilisin family serine protease
MSGKRILRALSVGCVMMMVLTGLTMFVGADKNEDKVRVIVLFKDKVDKKVVEDNNGDVLDTYDIIPGLVADMTKSDIKELKKSDKVKSVEEDAEADAKEEGKSGGGGGTKPPAQVEPWGIQKICADIAWNITKGAGIKVAVMDTGIDTGHSDLKVAGGTNVIGGSSYNDDNGHGTHCAGIIAALDNTIGVKGVGPSISLYSIKVLNKQGSGSYSNFIKGLDWAISNHMQVVSMSFGGTSTTTAFESACSKAKANGIVLVAAAGNSGGSILYPAAYDSVIAVGATDKSNTIASWSCYGTQLDLVAPGVDIYSTYMGNTYKTLSGTSMACPHVAGTVALVLATTITDTYDKNGNKQWDPTEVQNCLQSTATNLGTAGWDKYTGYGLVDALKAVGG